MNSDTAATLRAAQLIYSNVEEGDSPRRRRGFQVWLHTQDDTLFPSAARDEVESLVSGFHRPPGVPTGFVRRIFTPLSDGVRVMLAESRSNPARDKFNREGRFHTHALIFDAAAFREVARNNPFAVFGGGFAFQKLPEEAERYDDWKRGHSPEVTIAVAHPPPLPTVPDAEAATEPVPDDVLPLIAQWLVDDRTERPTFAMPFAPARVELFLAKLFALLPLDLRLRASFDTLWPGRGKYTPQIAGAGTADALSLWTYRQTIRYDLRRKQCQPKIDIGPHWKSELVRHWHGATEWSEADRAGSWALAEWLNGAGDGPRPSATEAAIAHAGTWPPAQERWQDLVAAKCAAEFPGELARLGPIGPTALAYFGEWSKEGFAKLDDGIPVPVAAGWIEAALRALPMVPEEVANAVLHWKPDRSGPEIDRLPWIAYRWLPDHANLLHDKLQSESVPGEEWIREYCRRTLPEEFRTAGAVDALLNRLLWSAEPPLEIARWYYSVCRLECAPEQSAGSSRLGFLLSLDPATGWEPGFQWAEAREWALENLLAIYGKHYRIAAIEIGDAHPDVWAEALGGMNAPILCLGYRVDFSSFNDLHPRLFRWIAERDSIRLTASFRQRLACEPGADGRVAPYASRAGDKTLEAAKILAKEKKVRELAELLSDFPDSHYYEIASNNTLPSFRARIKLAELNPATGSWFLGLVLQNNMIVFNALEVTFLKALVASAVKIHRIDTESFEEAAPHAAHRLHWLMWEFLKKVPAGEKVRSSPTIAGD